MAIFKRRADDREQIRELKSRMAAMAERLESTDAEKSALAGKVDSLSSRLDDTDAAAAAAKRDLAGKVDGITFRLDEAEAAAAAEVPPPPPATRDELTELKARVELIALRLDEIDLRVTSISTELANQISELSGDIEALGDRDTPTDEIVDALRDAQTRLANEQARYQIAFRQDLADLAHRLRRP